MNNMLEMNTVDGFVWESLYESERQMLPTITNKVIASCTSASLNCMWVELLRLLLCGYYFFFEVFHFVVWHVNIYIQRF